MLATAGYKPSLSNQKHISAIKKRFTGDQAWGLYSNNIMRYRFDFTHNREHGIGLKQSWIGTQMRGSEPLWRRSVTLAVFVNYV